MKTTVELLGLPVFSIEEGKESGIVDGIVINPDKGVVEYLIVIKGSKYLGVKALPFASVEGIGEYAVTIQHSSLILNIKDVSNINELLEKDINVKSSKVITPKGKLLGTVDELLINDEKEGEIAGCVLSPANDLIKSGIITMDQIITFGKDILIVKNEVEETLIDNISNPEKSAKQKEVLQSTTSITKTDIIKPVEEKVEAISKKEQKTEEPVKLFEERQRTYILGRKTSTCILDSFGKEIVGEGVVITEEIINKASKAGKLLELTMNTLE